jgi:hypothetical protein
MRNLGKVVVDVLLLLLLLLLSTQVTSGIGSCRCGRNVLLCARHVLLLL